MLYATVGIVAIVIHLILNHRFFINKEEKNSVNKAFKGFIWASLVYYITDACWGIFYDLQIPIIIYLDTLLYYFAMAMSVVMLCRYVSAYLRFQSWFGKFINYFGIAFGILEVFLLVFNHFVHIFFWIDADGTYHAYAIRYIVLALQVVLCVLLAIQTGVSLRKSLGEMRKRHLTIFLFCVEMTVAIATQIAWPLLPLYSIGLVVGICIIHTFVKENEKEEQYKVLKSLSEIFFSMHVIDLTNDTVEEFSSQNIIREVVNHQDGASKMMIQVMHSVMTEAHLEPALAFTDLKTLPERMKDKKAISAEFIGKYTGWFLALFATIETDREGRPTKVIYATRVVEEEKQQEETLIRQSQTDELTGLYNRRAYEEDIYELKSIPEEFTYIALDVNGLKVVNDTIGHAAGDELIIGASECMRNVFGPYGKVYRTGGDEFVVITLVAEEKLKLLLREFDDAILNWSGKLVNELTIAYGYVSKRECMEYTMPQFATEADKRMYQSKGAYYQKKGIDRRGQQEAHRTLCETYTKILKVNLTEDSYQIINMSEMEEDINKGVSDKMSIWLKEFGLSGQVHEEDLSEYLEKTNLDYMREYFRQGNTALSVHYRRKVGDVFKWVVMDMILTNDYSHENQTIFLYVK